MYVDLEKFDSCQSLTSSSPAVITNVLCVYSENRFSHLESSNETQIFSGDQEWSSEFWFNYTLNIFYSVEISLIFTWLSLLTTLFILNYESMSIKCSQAFSSRFLETSILEDEQRQQTSNNVIQKNNEIIEAFRISWNSDNIR